MRIKLLLTPRYDRDPFDKCNGKDDGDKKLGGTHLLPPLGIATLTAFLKKHNFSVDQDDLRIKAFYHNLRTEDSNKQIDLRVFNDERRVEKFIKFGQDSEFEAEGEKILKLTNCRGFDVFGFSLSETFTPSPAAVALTLGKLLKDKYGATILIGGNVHLEVAEKMVKTKFIDYLICGDGEDRLLALCQNFEEGFPLEKTPGIFFAKRGKITNTPIPERVASRRKVPIRPCFDGLPLDLYRPKVTVNIDGTDYTRRILILPYIFVNGCPNRCAYCPDALGEYKVKQPEEVAMDLKILSRKYKTKYFFFVNTEINPTYEYAEKVASSLIKNDLNISWSDCASFLAIDNPLLKKLKEAGAVTLVFGLESASRRVLKFIQKPLPPLDYIKNILKTSYKLGIRNELDIICGFPYEREEDVDLTIKFFSKVKKYVQQCHVSKFRPAGLIGKYPEKWGIRLLKLEPSTHRMGHAVPFEEINLQWGEKAKKIDYFYEKIQGAVRSPGVHRIPTMSIDEYLFTYLLRSPFHQIIRHQYIHPLAR